MARVSPSNDAERQGALTTGRSAVLLGVPHELQGPRFPRYVRDSSYSILVTALIRSNEVDFVFEESAGRGPSIAEEIAKSVLGAGHYLDIDPPQHERPKHGIAPICVSGFPVDPCNSADVCSVSIVEEQRKREKLWLLRIAEQHFTNGLVIVGLSHTLSVSFGLLSVRIGIRDACNYIPFAKLGTQAHPIENLD